MRAHSASSSPFFSFSLSFSLSVATRALGGAESQQAVIDHDIDEMLRLGAYGTYLPCARCYALLFAPIAAASAFRLGA